MQARALLQRRVIPLYSTLSQHHYNHLPTIRVQQFHSNTGFYSSKKKKDGTSSKRSAISSAKSFSSPNHRDHLSNTATDNNRGTANITDNITNAFRSNFVKEALSDKEFATLATKSLDSMTPRERTLLKQQLEKNFLKSIRDKLMRDDPQVASQVTDNEILDFARQLTKGLVRKIPDSTFSNQMHETERREQREQTSDQSHSEMARDKLKKEIEEMSTQEKNSVYTFTLYRIMLKLISGKRLNRGNIVDMRHKDAPMLSPSEQRALRHEVKRQFLSTAGLTDQNAILSCFQRAEYAIYRFNAMQLGNHSLPPRTKSDMEKYKKLEEIGEPDSPIEKYWNEYYKQEGSMDEWYCDYGALKDFFKKIQEENAGANKSFDRALILGAGMSSLGAELLGNGFAHRITQIDISRFAIFHMQEVYKSILKKQQSLLEELPPDAKDKVDIMEFKHVDVREMSDDFEDEVFDVVVDKACLDTVLTSESGEIDIPDMELEVWRVLKSHTGVWVIVSVLPEEGIRSLLVQCPWKVDLLGSVPFAGQKAHANIYKLTKTQDEPENKQEGE